MYDYCDFLQGKERNNSETLVWCMQEIIEQNMQAPKGSAKNKLKRKELRA